MDKKISEAEKQSNVTGLIALYSGVTQNLSMIHSADDAVENKIATFFAASIVILILVLDKAPHLHLFAVLGFILLCAELLLSLIAIWSRTYNGVAVNVSENTDYLDMENSKLVLQLISDAQESIGESTRILNKKAKLYKKILILFTIGIMLCMIAYF
jgi:hypothetical protein